MPRTTKRLQLEPDPLLDTTQLAEHCGVPVSSVRQWRRDRSGPPAIKLPKSLRWRKSDVDEWIEARREGDVA